MGLSRSNTRSIALMCLLSAVTFAVFWPITHSEFVPFDDPAYVTENHMVMQGVTWQGAVWAFATGHAANWHPLTWLSHMLDVELFGLRAGAHHLVNLAFHIANALLLFLLLQRMTGAAWRSALVAALFALHPLHVESVAWIAERKDVLSTFFGLMALWSYATYAKNLATRSSAPEFSGKAAGSSKSHKPGLDPPVDFFYAVALVCFALSLMSKPTLVTLPFVLLLLDYWPLQRLSFSTRQPPGTRVPRLILEKLPFLALAVVSSTVTLLVQKHGGSVVDLELLSLSQRLANAAVAYVAYLIKTIWPAGLAFYYPLPAHWAFWQVAGAVVVLVMISIGVIAARRWRYLAVGWWWFLGMLVPMIGLVQVGNQALADRYTYWPLVGIFIAVVWGLAEAATRGRLGRTVPILGTVVLLVGCAALARRQVSFWQNGETLCSQALAVTKANFVVYDNLASYYWQVGKTQAAIENCQKSLAIRRRFEPLNNLGLMLASQGEFTNAIACYETALQLRPTEVGARNNLAQALVQSGRLDDALAQCHLILQRIPTDLEARNRLGVVLTMQGKLDAAIAQFREVLGADPNQASAHGNLANALAAQSKIPEATEEFRHYVRLQPDDPRGHQGLGRGLLAQGKWSEAVEQFGEALRLNPDLAETHYQMGLALEGLSRIREAVAHYEAALRLKPDYAEAILRLETIKPRD